MKYFVWLLAVFFMLATACGESGDDENEGSTDTDVDTDTDADTDADTDTDTDTDTDSDSDGDVEVDTDDREPWGLGDSLEGTWGLVTAVGTINENVPLAQGQPSWTSTRAWFVVDIESDGRGNLTLTEKGCFTKIKVVSALDGAYATLPDEAWEHSKPSVRKVRIESEDPASAFASETSYIQQGLNLCDPANDPMPGKAAKVSDAPSCDGTCGGQCDTDRDGKAGVSGGLGLGKMGCTVYLSTRIAMAFDGKIVDKDTIEGAIVDNSTEQVIHGVGGTGAVLCGDVGAIVVKDDPCAQHQYFKMVRLDDGATCQDVRDLTDCDEKPAQCDSNEELALDPKHDLKDDCK